MVRLLKLARVDRPPGALEGIIEITRRPDHDRGLNDHREQAQERQGHQRELDGGRALPRGSKFASGKYASMY